MRAAAIQFKIPARRCHWVEGFVRLDISASETCPRRPEFQVRKGQVNLWTACQHHAARAVLLGYQIKKIS